MTDLKPCPFCGGEAILQKGTDGRCWIECNITKSHCSVIPKTWAYKTKKEAIEAWNRRVDNG
ncbi:MAG: restriction alleviation protein, Lar family [Ruminococcaceae bacterium]|nr:restriction alleviation protein, Lar family [Oscillospiraceae bacterium]